MNDAVDRVLSGDKEAFSLIVREYGSCIRAFLAAHLNDLSAIDDLTQETFISAYHNIRSYQPDRDLRAWIRGIARNKLMTHLRMTYREKGRMEAFRAQIVEELSDGIEGATADDTTTAIEKLMACMKKLPERLRIVTEARYYGRETVAALAVRFRTTVTAISSLLYRGREALLGCMEKEG